MIKKLMIK